MPIVPKKYDYDVSHEAIMKTPHFYRVTPETGAFKEDWIAFMDVMFNALDNMFNIIRNDVDAKKTFLDVTGQHLSLENYLNNTYDNVLRRIFITENDAGGEYTETWYLQTETDPDNKVWYLQGESDPAPKTFYLQPELENITHFVVNIPVSITYDEDEVRGRLDNYVLATKNYTIITF